MVVLLATALLIPAPAQTKEVTAVIRLRDGELASHMMVDVGYRPAGLTRNFTVQTRLRSNADGEVTFKLPAEGSHEVVVDVFDKPTRADLPVDVVSASQTVSLPTARNLVFQCRGSGDLKVEIRPGNELPEEVRFRIDITRQCVRYRRAIRRRELTQEGGKIEFADLHPGEYKVRLMVDDYIDMKWERTIQVADGSRKNMVLPLPEIQFGSVLGKVMRLGDSPFSRAAVTISHASLGGSRHVPLDSRGRFVARGIPAGPIVVSVNHLRGRTEYQGHSPVYVEAGKAASAGVIRLKDSSRWRSRKRAMKGTLKFAGGTPVVGAGLGRRMGGGIRMWYPTTKVDEDGKFDYKIERMAKFVRFGLHESEAWLKRSGRKLEPAFKSFDPHEENIFVRVGEQDRVLSAVLPGPDDAYGRITLVAKNFGDDQFVGAMLRIDLPNGQFRSMFRQRESGPVVVSQPEAESGQPKQQDRNWFVPFVPPGKRYIHLATTTLGLRAVSVVDRDDETITVDATESGRVVIHLGTIGLERRCLIEAYDWTSPANWASERNTELQDDLPSMPIYTWDGVPGWSRLADEPVPTEWGFPKTKINADGSITPPRLGVGRYRMQVRGPKQNSEWLDFKIKRGDEIHFESQDSDAGITLKQVPGRQP